jgi:hypothetical protein
VRKRNSPRHSKTRKQAEAAGYRSGFEHRVAGQLDEAGAAFEYEPKEAVMEYRVEETRKYLPDFVINGIIVLECKGRLTAADRKKMLLVKKQHPDKDIRLLFQFDNKLAPRSKTRYSDWAKKYGFPYAVETIPKSWMRTTSK